MRLAHRSVGLGVHYGWRDRGLRPFSGGEHVWPLGGKISVRLGSELGFGRWGCFGEIGRAERDDGMTLR